MFRVKICGITNVNDAMAVARTGADAVGLNFFPKSPRYVDPERAQAIIEALPPRVVKVGLFVNADPEVVCRMFDQLGLDLIQLHGDEPPELLTQLGERPVMRAFRLGEGGLRPVGEYLDRCRQLKCVPRLVLIDAMVRGVYGGSGQVADWGVARRYAATAFSEEHAPPPPLVLAGGLTPDNVAEAIRTVRPLAVDTASGVESAPGRKDPATVEAFVRAAKTAFAMD